MFFLRYLQISSFCNIAQQADLAYYPLIYKTGLMARTQRQGIVENIQVDVKQIQAFKEGWIPSKKVNIQS